MCAYPLSLINTFVSAGLVFLHLPESLVPLRAKYDWNPPFRTWTPIVIFFFLSNLFLVCAPLVPPAKGFKVYDQLPYWVSFVLYSHSASEGTIPDYTRSSCMCSCHARSPSSESRIGISPSYGSPSIEDTRLCGNQSVKRMGSRGTYSRR